MIEVTEALKNYLKSNGRTFKVKLVSGANEYGNSSESHIETLKIESTLGGDNVGIGSTGCAKLEVTLFDKSNVKFQGNRFKVFIKAEDGTENWTQLGEFKAEKPTVKDGAITFVGYDRMNETGGMYESALEFPTTAGVVWREMCQNIAGMNAQELLPSGLAEIQLPADYLTGYTYRTAMSYLAAYLGCNAVVNSSGNFEMIPLLRATTNGVLSPDNCEVPETEEDDYKLGYIVCNRGEDEKPLKKGTGTRGFSCVCPFMTSDRLTEIANTYLYSSDKSVSVRYRVGKVSIPKGDFRIEVGDWLSYAKDDQSFVFPVMKHTFEFDGGIMNTVESIGKTPEEDEGSVLSLEARVKNAVNSKIYSVSKEHTSVVKKFSEAINGALGLYETEITNADGSVQTYLHNTAEIADATYIATINAGGFAFATGTGCWNSGSPTWTSGMTASGNAVMNTINVYKIKAGQIDVADLSALKATIAGWTIDKNRISKSLSSDNVTYEAVIQAASEPEKAAFVIIKTDENGTKSYPFRVFYNGNAELTGKITATSGSIGGFTISKDQLTYGEIGKNNSFAINPSGTSTNYNIGGRYDNKWALMIGSNFGVTCYGNLYAENVHLKGEITATSGNIAGFDISSKRLLYGSVGSANSFLLCPGGSENKYNIAGSGSIANWAVTLSDNFGVTTAGKLYATGAVVSGEITATSGKIAGWSIAETYTGAKGIVSKTGNYEIGIKTSSNSGAAAFYVRDTSDNTSPFYVTNDGELHATSADIEGKITATSGNIAGFSISSKRLLYGSVGSASSFLLCPGGTSGKYSVGGSGSISNWALTVGSKFGVQADGVVYASGLFAQDALLTGISLINNLSIVDSLILYKNTPIQYQTTASQRQIVLNYDGAVKVGIDTVNLRLYGKNVYLGSTSTAVQSDARLKTDIAAFTPAHEAFFNALQPRTYRYIEGMSGRTHFGFVAQDVKAAIESSGLTTQQVAVYVELESDRDGFNGTECALRYDEIIALNTHMIQKLLNEISSLKERINQYESNIQQAS